MANNSQNVEQSRRPYLVRDASSPIFTRRSIPANLDLDNLSSTPILETTFDVRVALTRVDSKKDFNLELERADEQQHPDNGDGIMVDSIPAEDENERFFIRSSIYASSLQLIITESLWTYAKDPCRFDDYEPFSNIGFHFDHWESRLDDDSERAFGVSKRVLEPELGGEEAYAWMLEGLLVAWATACNQKVKEIVQAIGPPDVELIGKGGDSQRVQQWVVHVEEEF